MGPQKFLAIRYLEHYKPTNYCLFTHIASGRDKQPENLCTFAESLHHYNNIERGAFLIWKSLMQCTSASFHNYAHPLVREVNILQISVAQLHCYNYILRTEKPYV